MRSLEVINSEKVCTKCGLTKNLSSFYKKTENGKPFAQCIKCIATTHRNYHSRRPNDCKTCGEKVLRLSKYCRKCSHRTAEYLTKYKANRKYSKRNNFCLDCGVEVGLGSKYCTRHRSLGDRNAAWKGGVTIIKERIRDLFEYRQWRSDIFTRDKFTCTNCGNIGGKLQAHHVIPMNVLMQKYEITSIEAARNCSELFNLNNGVTLCEGCHRDLHKEKGLKYEFYQH